MKNKNKLLSTICSIAGALFLGFGLITANSVMALAETEPVTTAETIKAYYNEFTLVKDGAGSESVTYSGLVPYGTGTISLGTYDMTQTNNLETPLFTILPHKEWSSGDATSASDERFFYVDLTSGNKKVTFRFGKASRDDANQPAVFIGSSDDTVKARKMSNPALYGVDYPLTVLPYRYDGTKVSSSVCGEEKTEITSPTPIGFYINNNVYYMDAFYNNAKTNVSSVVRETSAGSGEYRYSMSNFETDFTSTDLKKISVSVRFDKKTVAKDEAWVMFTSIAGNDFKYNINYETWGGQIISANYLQKFSPLTTNIDNLPTQIQKDNYQFSHWYYGTNPDNKVNEAGFADWLQDQTGDITLNAYYIPYDYKVTYNLNYPNAPLYEFGKINYINYLSYSLQEVNVEDYPENQIFDGWYTQAVGGDKVESITVLKDTQVYAQWKAGCLVTFDYGDGIKDVVPVELSGVTDAPTAPQKSGYDFVGWQYNDATFDFTTPITANIELKAVYEPKQYKVQFYIDGEKVKEENVLCGQSISVVPDIPQKEGYKNATWYCGNQALTTESIVTRDMTFVAKYDKMYFTIKFDTADGTPIEETSVAYGEQIDGTILHTLKDGYTLVGWQVDEKSFDFSTPVTKEYTLKAIWEIKSYQVHIVLNGEEIALITKNHGEQVTLQEIVDATGMDVSNVYLDASHTQAYDTETKITQHHTLYIPQEFTNESTVNWTLIVVIIDVCLAIIGLSIIIYTLKKNRSESK